MPIYEYRCKTCGKTFEYNQRITEAALTKCPKEICESECKGEGEVSRMISKNIGLVFNGSGFYLTDYVHKHGSTAGNGHSHSNGNGSNANGSNGSAKTNGTNGESKTNGEAKPAAASAKPAETKSTAAATA